MMSHENDLFCGLIGQPIGRFVLQQAIHRPAGAYLFYGPSGLGKKVFAERFAHALLEMPTETHLEAHPDFIRLTREPESREITVKQVRELLNRLHLSSARGGRRVALIEQADRLNEEACNALLKDVEEPGQGVVFLCIAEQMDRLPGTLRSRLVPLRFDRVSRQEMEGWLVQEKGCSVEDARRIAQRSGGIPVQALALCAGEEEVFSSVAHSLVRALLSGESGQVVAILDGFVKTLEKKEEVESAWQALIKTMAVQLEKEWETYPETAIRAGRALAHTWRLVGSSVPPRLGFEWSAVADALRSDGRIAALLENEAA